MADTPHTKPLIHSSTVDISHAIDHNVDDSIFPVAHTTEEQIFFDTNPAPEYLDELTDEARRFINLQHAKGRKKIVLVTSGGTSVPLENNTVRFIDNFSAGTRGASSAEQFLAAGYSVIFLYREFSLLPYNRRFTHKVNTFFLDYIDDKGQIKSDYLKEVLDAKRLYEKYLNIEEKLLILPYTTVNQYLYSLRSIALLMNNPDCLFYLASAVSDFYVPASKLPQHKIQSRDYGLGDGKTDKYTKDSSSSTDPDGKLHINLDPVPKFLKRLVDSWAPKAMLISFKLETDDKILVLKACTALEKYGHQLVIGNLLQTRSKEVIFVTPTNKTGQWIKLPEGSKTSIEEMIIIESIKHHDLWISKSFT